MGATLYVYRFLGQNLFLRMGVNGGERPACPTLFDEVVEIPVIEKGDPPPKQMTRTVPMVADWLSDLVEEGGDGYE